MEDRIVVQSHEIQALLLDNQRLAASHVALKQDVAAAQQDLRRLSMTASTVKAERDAQVREVYERSLKLEAEARSVEGLSAELDRVRVDIKEVRAESKELSEKLESIDGDIARIKSESQQLLDLKAEIETMHREIQRGRNKRRRLDSVRTPEINISNEIFPLNGNDEPKDKNHLLLSFLARFVFLPPV